MSITTQNAGKLAECRKCGEEYEPTPSQVRNNDWICKACKREYDRQWREKRREQGLPASGSDTWDPEKKEKWQQEYYSDPEVLERKAKNQRKYRNDPDKRHKFEARWELNRAIKRGDLERQPCESCGATENIHGHHEDYSKPLDVIWLCRTCHDELHAKAEGRNE